MRVFQGTTIELTIPASPRAKRLPQGSSVAVPVRHVRRELNVSEEEVARVSSLTADEISQIETHQVPEIHRLTKYAQALGGELHVTIAFGSKTYRLNLDPDALPASEQEAIRGWSELDDPFPRSPEPHQARNRK